MRALSGQRPAICDNSAMLADDDKKRFAAQISVSEECVGAELLAYEERIGSRLERFEAISIAEFHKWPLSPSVDPRIDAIALRTMELGVRSSAGQGG